MHTLVWLALAALQSPAPEPDRFVEVDFAKYDRSLRKEPAYVAEPRYGLFVLDPAGQFACWAVFDKSAKDAPHYDVLYFDRNGNRDLTEEGERITAKWDESMAPAGLGILLKVGDVRVPGTELVHKGLRFGTAMKSDRPGFWFDMKWAGKTGVSGGYSPAGPDTTIYATTPKDAPILRPAPLGELTFALYTWGQDEATFTAGRQGKLSIMIGKAGSTRDAISVMDEHFLDLKADQLTATLSFRTASGAATLAVPIRQHC